MDLLPLIFLPIVGIICVTLIIRAYFEIIIISGNSMYPTLKHGDFILIKKLLPIYKYKVGDIVVLPNPYNSKQLVVKRIVKTKVVIVGRNVEHLAWIEGDNSEVSQDSRNYGWINKNSIEGRLIKLWQRTKN